MQPESAGTATTEIKAAPVRARFGSSEVPASRATQDRIDIPEFAAILRGRSARTGSWTAS